MEVRLGRYAPQGVQPVAYDRVLDFQNTEEMIASGCNAFIVENMDGQRALSAVERIRSAPAVCHYPVFSMAPHSVRFATLCDGVVGNPHEASSRAESMLTLLLDVNEEALLRNVDFRLMAYLYMRPGAELQPVADHCSEEVYSYPIAQCMSEYSINHRQWLDDLRLRGQIEPFRLVDRIRVCPKCLSPNLNFIDVCPNCKNIDITKKELIHCFTCGRVGLMDNFMRENALLCPFCGTQLRHLGSDYDHPLESMVCEACAESFVEPEVVAACYGCKAKNETTDLNVVSLFSYRITEKGRISARVGEMENAYALFDRLGNVSYTYFEQFMDWNLGLLKRYKGEQGFTVIALCFDNIEEIGGVIGGPRMAQMVDAITLRIKELLRTTDVVMRSSLGVLYFFLPHTDKEQCKIVTGRLLALKDSVQIEGAPKLEISIEARTFPQSADVVSTERNAGEILLSMLSGMRSDTRSA